MFPLIRTFLQWSCIKPTFKLQQQLVFSYGGTAVLTLLLMIVLSILAAQRAGTVVQQQAQDMLVQQVIASLHETGDATADVVAERVLQRLTSTTALLSELVRDRIVGYSYPGDGSLAGGILGSATSNNGGDGGDDKNGVLRQLQEEWYHDVHVPFRNSDPMSSSSSSSSSVTEENDNETTIPSSFSSSNQYPLHATKRRPATSSRPFLPLDWNITLNLIKDDDAADSSSTTTTRSLLQEHLVYPERVTLFQELNLLSKISTASASFRFPGICNPNTHPKKKNNNKNDNTTTTTTLLLASSCTEENNNITSGGTWHPVPSTRYIYEKAADLSILLKALWESDPAILSIAIHFHNLGVGASVRFPGQVMNVEDNDNDNNTDVEDSYISIGCDWMLTTWNPYTERPLYSVVSASTSTWSGSGSPSGPGAGSGSSASSSSSSSASSPSSSLLNSLLPNCHPAGTVVSYRHYNPLERPYCRDQARHPGQVRMFGPHLDTKLNLWRLTFGQAIFDTR
jgi:hypothetical protein